MSRTYRKSFRYYFENLKDTQNRYKEYVEDTRRKPEYRKELLHDCDNFDDWYKAECSISVKDGSNNWLHCWNRGYAGGPPHPTTGKIMGWDDDLPRHRSMHKMTNCVRRRQGKDIIREGIHEYNKERNQTNITEG